MTSQVYNVLFVSFGESARGLIAQAILNHWAGEGFQAWCATDHDNQVNPLAVELLKSNQLWNGQRGMNFEQFLDSSLAPLIDFVISVGDRLAESLWNAFPGSPVKAQWPITDPAVVKGDLVRCKAAFRRAFSELENRVKLFALVWDNSSRAKILAA